MGPAMWRCPECRGRYPRKASAVHYAACKKRRQQAERDRWTAAVKRDMARKARRK